MNEHVLFSDETAMFRTPAEPKAGDKVTIRFRTAACDAEAVTFVCGEERLAMEVRPVPWEKARSKAAGEAQQQAGGEEVRPAAAGNEAAKAAYDYWAVDVQLGRETICYHFEINRNGEVWKYNRQGPVWVCDPADEFRIIPDFSTPDWAKGAVFYQIFVDRFFNGDKTNDVKTGEYEYLGAPVERAESWEAAVREPDVGRFYGGDLAGVIKKLDYLAELGVEGIYLNPIFVSPSSHKYDTQDYDHVDPHFGRIVNDGDYVTRTTDAENLAASDALLAELIEEAHRRGIRVILDGVFNHCGSFHKWLDREGIYAEAARRKKESDRAESATTDEAKTKDVRAEEKIRPGAFQNEESPYREFFQFSDPAGWPGNASYEGWWDYATLPKLNYEGSEKLQKEILRIAKKWISPPYNADGWRLDVAADLGHSAECNHAFWKKFRREVKKTRPDALILAEHYGHAGDWLAGDEWDSVMNYDAFMEPVSFFFTGMEKHSDAGTPELLGDAETFYDTERRARAAFSAPSLQVAMNELDNHDHSRFLTRTNHRVGRLHDLGTEAASEGVDKEVLKQAVLLQMIWPGMPTIYYGDEAGLAGFTDPDDRRPFPWGKEDRELQKYYKKMIALRRKYPVLRTGSLVRVPCFADTGGGGNDVAGAAPVPGALAYGRFDEKEAVLAIAYTGDAPVEAVLPLAPLGLGDEVLRVTLGEGGEAQLYHWEQ